MDIRIRGLSGALMRRFAAKAGSRERERAIIEKLITLYVDDQINPDALSVAASMGARGGAATAANRSAGERSAAAKTAARARWDAAPKKV